MKPRNCLKKIYFCLSYFFQLLFAKQLNTNKVNYIVCYFQEEWTYFDEYLNKKYISHNSD